MTEEFSARSQLKWAREGNAWIVRAVSELAYEVANTAPGSQEPRS